MSYQRAIAIYTGQSGTKRMNCAQSVLSGFTEECAVSRETIEKFRDYGNGRAPEGMCGAYYAAKTLLEKSNVPDEIKGLDDVFIHTAGSIKCKDIRKICKLNCRGCVETSSRYLESVLSSK